MTQPSDEDRLIKTVGLASQQAAKQLKLHPFGFGTKGPGRIKGFSLQYESDEAVNIDRARELIVKLAKELRMDVQRSIQSAQLDWDATKPEFFYLSIAFTSSNTSGRYNSTPGYVGLVDLSKGKVEFTTYNPETGDFTPIHLETYEEAYRKVYGQPFGVQ